MTSFTRLLREPLLHFLFLGGLLFVAYSAVEGPREPPAEVIVVGPERIEHLARGFDSVWGRPPGDDELRAMIDDFVREEVYYREALALGLDRDDTVIRRRLRLKMEFLTDTGADLLQPATGELEAWLADNAQAFAVGERLAFEQIFLGKAPAPARVAAALTALGADPRADPAPWSERTLLPARLGLSAPEAVDGVFGPGFFERLAALPRGVWVGPMASAYGAHVVRIVDATPARAPALDEVRDAVLRDWREARALQLRELYFRRLRERYVVEILASDTAPTPAR